MCNLLSEGALSIKRDLACCLRLMSVERAISRASGNTGEAGRLESILTPATTSFPTDPTDNGACSACPALLLRHLPTGADQPATRVELAACVPVSNLYKVS